MLNLSFLYFVAYRYLDPFLFKSCLREAVEDCLTHNLMVIEEYKRTHFNLARIGRNVQDDRKKASSRSLKIVGDYLKIGAATNAATKLGWFHVHITSFETKTTCIMNVFTCGSFCLLSNMLTRKYPTICASCRYKFYYL